MKYWVIKSLNKEAINKIFTQFKQIKYPLNLNKHYSQPLSSGSWVFIVNKKPVDAPKGNARFTSR